VSGVEKIEKTLEKAIVFERYGPKQSFSFSISYELGITTNTLKQ
jgi:hypothetical protein